MSKLGTYNVEIDVDAPVHSDKIAPPPKKWRNWYFAKVNLHLTDVNIRVAAGEAWPGSGVWPSKEIAEAKAMEQDDDHPPVDSFEYLGAEPEQ